MTYPTQEASEAAKEYCLELYKRLEDPDLRMMRAFYKKQIEVTTADFLAGAQWQLTNLAEKGVEGARKLFVDITDFDNGSSIPTVYENKGEIENGYENDFQEFLEALPVLAKINQLQEQVEKLEARNKELLQKEHEFNQTFLVVKEARDKALAHIKETNRNQSYSSEQFSTLTARITRLEEALRKIDEIRVLEAPVTNLADKMRYVARQALAKDE